MLLKVLCFVLLACTLIQAEDPKPAAKDDDGWGILNPGDWLRSTHEALHDLFGRILAGVRKNTDAKLNTTKYFGSAGIDVAETGVKLVLSFPRMLLKMMQKPADQVNGTDFFDGVSRAFSDVLDENGESKKKAFNSSMAALNSAWNTTLVKFNTKKEMIEAVAQLGSDIAEGVLNNSNIPEDKKTEVKTAKKEIEKLMSADSDATDSTTAAPKHKKKFSDLAPPFEKKLTVLE